MNQPQAAHLQASDGPVIKQMKGTHVMGTHQVPFSTPGSRGGQGSSAAHPKTSPDSPKKQEAAPGKGRPMHGLQQRGRIRLVEQKEVDSSPGESTTWEGF